MESQGLYGGIIILWKLGIATFDVFHCCSQYVTIVITESNGLTWLLSIMYASTNYRDRRTLWQEVTTLIDQEFSCCCW